MRRLGRPLSRRSRRPCSPAPGRGPRPTAGRGRLVQRADHGADQGDRVPRRRREHGSRAPPQGQPRAAGTARRRRRRLAGPCRGVRPAARRQRTGSALSGSDGQRVAGAPWPHRRPASRGRTRPCGRAVRRARAHRHRQPCERGPPATPVRHPERGAVRLAATDLPGHERPGAVHRRRPPPLHLLPARQRHAAVRPPGARTGPDPHRGGDQPAGAYPATRLRRAHRRLLRPHAQPVHLAGRRAPTRPARADRARGPARLGVSPAGRGCGRRPGAGPDRLLPAGGTRIGGVGELPLRVQRRPRRGRVRTVAVTDIRGGGPPEGLSGRSRRTAPGDHGCRRRLAGGQAGRSGRCGVAGRGHRDHRQRCLPGAHRDHPGLRRAVGAARRAGQTAGATTAELVWQPPGQPARPRPGGSPRVRGRAGVGPRRPATAARSRRPARLRAGHPGQRNG